MVLKLKGESGMREMQQVRLRTSNLGALNVHGPHVGRPSEQLDMRISTPWMQALVLQVFFSTLLHSFSFLFWVEILTKACFYERRKTNYI